MKAALARLHVLLARDSPAALVIRHGTAKSVCTLLWNRAADTFVLGQWMRGRIDTATCDLSPNGAHFLYTARKYALHRPSRQVDPIGQSIAWTVVSRAPYLKAVAYYPHPAQGGWFLSPQQYAIPGYVPHADDRESPELSRVEADAPLPSLYAARLIRAGWTMQDRRAQFRPRIVFVKAAAAGWYHQTRRRLCHRRFP